LPLGKDKKPRRLQRSKLGLQFIRMAGQKRGEAKDPERVHRLQTDSFLIKG